MLAGTPLKTDRRDRLDYMSGGAIAEGLPRDRVALVAEAEIDLPPGDYTLRTISDDGIRVWMDDERIIDRWTPHESASRHGAGRRAASAASKWNTTRSADSPSFDSRY